MNKRLISFLPILSLFIFLPLIPVNAEPSTEQRFTQTVLFGTGASWINSENVNKIRKIFASIDEDLQIKRVEVKGFSQKSLIDPFPELPAARANSVKQLIKKLNLTSAPIITEASGVVSSGSTSRTSPVPWTSAACTCRGSGSARSWPASRP